MVKLKSFGQNIFGWLLMFYLMVVLLSVTCNSMNPDNTLADFETGKIVFVSDRDGNSEIYLMDGDGENEQRLTNNSYRDLDPSWSPNGKQIVFLSRDNQDDVFHNSMNVVDLETGLVTQLLDTTGFLENPIWSPNGEWIAVGKAGELTLVSVKSKQEIQLTDFGNSATPQSWSKDGEKLLFISNHEVPGPYPKLYSIQLTDFKIETIVEEQFPYLHNAVWSPDEQVIVYSAGLDAGLGKWDLSNNLDTDLVAKVDREIITTSLTYHEIDPDWLPDNEHLVFSMFNNEMNQDIYIISSLTNETIRLTDDEAYDVDPAWWSP